MLSRFTSVYRKIKYGEPVLVVSGLPRSGTSMLMNMLVAGGMSVLTDDVREADEDNPKGYFELERIKNLENETDKSWLQGARGKVVKVISHLLKELPADNFYYVILAQRDLREVIASQNAMLDRNSKTNPVDDDKAMELYRKHLVNVRFLARRNKNIEMLEVQYGEVIRQPGLWAERIDTFIGGKLDTGKMASVVDAALYRNRVAESES